ncbi:branched-chain amino acid ABC transporter permease [Hydrogenophaga palleronii]|uniref:branched-chain amino acid ABC transporter permease n=1 Tax=Hydrogenophaga palleronii TaxID=65655 RepID=UPI000826D709|nr:branched-chain amino acid ABC transporter permease [Hydrogenophaga palleronii]
MSLQRALRFEVFLVLALVIGYLAFQSSLAFLTTVIVYAILALSYSFIYGQAGIASMGHATLYGVASYAVAIFAARSLNDPLLGLLIGAAVGALTAWCTAWFFITTTRLTLAMLTIAVAQVFLEVANKAHWLTGGDDGFTGYEVGPVLGLFEFDMFGHTGYWYAAAILLVVYVVMERIALSDFGLIARAIKSDPGRIESLGGNVRRHLMKVYCVAGAVAGIAGAINAQTAAVVSLDSLGFMVSINVLIMVVLGGSRRLYGGIIGAVVFLGIQHAASNINPHHWLFVVGGLLIVVMTVMPGGLISLADRWRKPA